MNEVKMKSSSDKNAQVPKFDDHAQGIVFLFKKYKLLVEEAFNNEAAPIKAKVTAPIKAKEEALIKAKAEQAAAQNSKVIGLAFIIGGTAAAILAWKKPDIFSDVVKGAADRCQMFAATVVSTVGQKCQDLKRIYRQVVVNAAKNGFNGAVSFKYK